MPDTTTIKEARPDLAAVLAYLNPPQQDYDSLAAEIGDPSIYKEPFEQAVAAFFRLFASGYAYWQNVYDYARVHEYFYGGYLFAEAITVKNIKRAALADTMVKFFHETAETFIFQTRCENALICNSPIWLLESATESLDHCQKAIKLWNNNEILQEIARIEADSQAPDDDDAEESDEATTNDPCKQPGLHGPILCYLQLCEKYFECVKLCAELSLMPYQPAAKWSAATIKSHKTAIKDIMDGVRSASRELYSELQAYYASAIYVNEKYEARKFKSLRVEQADIVLRAVGHVGTSLVTPLFKRFKKQKGDAEIRKLATTTSGLRISQIRSGGFLNDAYQTQAGIKRLESLTVQLLDDDTELTIQLPDGDRTLTYTIESFEATISKFGTISVEFSFSAGDTDEAGEMGVSPAHIRTIESLIGPHIGELDILWKGAPSALDDESDEDDDKNDNAAKPVAKLNYPDDFVLPEVNNFVRYLLRTQTWIAKGRAEKFIKETDPQFKAVDKQLTAWKDQLRSLADQLPITSKDTLSKVTDQNRNSLQTAMNNAGVAISEWEFLSTVSADELKNPALKAYKDEGRALFPEGRVYGKLADVADEVMKRIKSLLFAIANMDMPDDEDDDDDKLPEYVDMDKWFSFDPHSGWQSIIMVNWLSRWQNGKKLDTFPTADDWVALTKEDEFKAFEIPGREARSGIDDWMMAVQPDGLKNLAGIRSHHTDVFYVGPNRAFTYFPDDPMFILTQYRDSARFIGDLRVIVLAHLVAAKRLAASANEVLASGSNGKSDLVAKRIRQIQTLRSKIASVFEMTQDITLTRYQDHSELISNMLSEIKIERLKTMLNEADDTLALLYGYLQNVD